MKKYMLIILLFAATGLVFASPAGKDGYTYTFKVEGVKDTVIYLASYYGGKQYYKDTTTVDGNGNFNFEGNEPLPGGIYSIVMPDQKSYFEFIITEPKFTMETKKSDLVMGMKVKGSEENQKFYEYLQFINNKQKEAQPLREKLKHDNDDKAAKEKLTKIDEEVNTYKLDLINNNQHLFVSKVFATSQDPKVPEAPKDENGKPLDPDFSYKYFKAHYFDGVDFSDDRLLRSPVFHNKLEHYITKLTVQIPDSINKEADMLIEKASANKEMYKYVVHYITNNFEKSKIMGMDAVFVHMAENVYCKDKAWWVDSAQKAKICDRSETLSPLLVGKRTPNVILQDTSESNWINLYQVKAEYTILFFWDPGCGHCKKAMPKLKQLYEKVRNNSAEIFAVCTEFETKDWKKYVTDNKLEWINVSDNPEINKNAAKYIHLTTIESLNFRDTYDIFSTPQVYLLDKDKKILAKKLSVEQLDDYLSEKLGLPKTVHEVKDDDKEEIDDEEDEEHSKKPKPVKGKKVN